jgi:flagellar hook assembly protein FlgD
VFDANDQLVRNLLKAKVPAGSHDIVWDGRIDSGTRAAGGTYFLRLRAGADSGTTRMILLR